MSRSRPELDSNIGMEPTYGRGFEVSQSVSDCLLKKMDLKEFKKEGVVFHRIYLHFLKHDKWITKFISVFPKEAFDSDEKFKDHKIEVQSNLENLMACYLTGSHIKRIVQESKSFGIVGYFNDIVEALTEKRYWDQPMNIKTIPEKNGNVSVARFPPFMSNPNDNRWSLVYSAGEIKRKAEWEFEKRKQ